MSKAHLPFAKAKSDVLDCLNQIFVEEMSGIVRYLHYSFMIMGHHRIPIQKWFRDRATESMDHATVIGEKITSYGGHPPAIAAKVEETGQHGLNDLLIESLGFESEALGMYKKLAELATRDGDVALEELARDFVRQETEHQDEVRKMIRLPESK